MKKFQRYAGVVLKKGNKVLLCKRSPEKSLPNTWSIPSGHLEDGRAQVKVQSENFMKRPTLN